MAHVACPDWDSQGEEPPPLLVLRAERTYTLRYDDESCGNDGTIVAESNEDDSNMWASCGLCDREFDTPYIENYR